MNIHRDDMNPVGYNYPLPVVPGYDTDKSFSTNLITNNATTAITVKPGVSGKVIYITDIIASAGAAVAIFFEDGDGTGLTGVSLAANAPFSHTFATPLPVTKSKNLMLRSSTGASIGITVNGFIR